MNAGRPRRSLALRLALLLAVLLVVHGALLGWLGQHAAAAREAETHQRLSRGLAAHIVSQWPQLAPTAAGPSTAAAQAGPETDAERAALLRMLATVNPAVQVYLLDAEGRVLHYIGEPGMVRTAQVDLAPVRSFLAGAALPLVGSDPMEAPGAGHTRLFSAAMFPLRAGSSRPPGYLYVVLDSPARARLVAAATPQHLGQGLFAVLGASLVVTLLVGLVALRRLTLPLQRLAERLQRFNLPGSGAALPAVVPRGDEVQRIGSSFDAMAVRIARQAEAAAALLETHRQDLAGLAHDLRTPLTALHGHLEALAATEADAQRRARLTEAALQQSNKVRRLSQQLFELATLRAAAAPLNRERFRIDELVSDAVQKYELGNAAVALAGPAPGPLEVEGDLQLIDRALTNLIDNAVRHAAADGPVQVRMSCSRALVQVVVEDQGPGLPDAVRRRLKAGQGAVGGGNGSSGGLGDVVFDPGPRAAGGLGLAIAQRIAELHGGHLEPLPGPTRGTRLCLSLPRA